jgi:hypothetical protein
MAQCRSCGAEIIWAVTSNGKRMPLDAETVRLPVGFLLTPGPVSDPTPVAVPGPRGGPVYLSHFATCPNATSTVAMNDHGAMLALAAPEPDCADDPVGWKEWNDLRLLALEHARREKLTDECIEKIRKIRESPSAERERLFHETVDAE